MRSLLIHIHTDDDELCGDCGHLYRLSDYCTIGACEEAHCELFGGEMEQYNTGLITEEIHRLDECKRAEVHDSS